MPINFVLSSDHLGTDLAQMDCKELDQTANDALVPPGEDCDQPRICVQFCSVKCTVQRQGHLVRLAVCSLKGMGRRRSISLLGARPCCHREHSAGRLPL